MLFHKYKLNYFADEVYWNWISEYQDLSEDFIREFPDKVDWDQISKYQVISDKFLKDYLFFDFCNNVANKK